MTIETLARQFCSLSLYPNASRAIAPSVTDNDTTRDYAKLLSLRIMDQQVQVMPEYAHKGPTNLCESSIANLSRFFDRHSLREVLLNLFSIIPRELLVDMLIEGDGLSQLLGYDFISCGLLGIVGSCNSIEELLSDELCHELKEDCEKPVTGIDIRLVFAPALTGELQEALCKKLQDYIPHIPGVRFLFSTALQTDNRLQLSISRGYLEGNSSHMPRLIGCQMGAQWILDTIFKQIRIPRVNLEHHFQRIITSMMNGCIPTAPIMAAFYHAQPELLVALCKGKPFQTILIVCQILESVGIDSGYLISNHDNYEEKNSFWDSSYALIRDKKCSFLEWQALLGFLSLLTSSQKKVTRVSFPALDIAVEPAHYFVPFELQYILSVSIALLPKVLGESDFENLLTYFISDAPPSSHPGITIYPPITRSPQIDFLLLLAFSPEKNLVTMQFSDVIASYSDTLQTVVLKRVRQVLEMTEQKPGSRDIQWIRWLLEQPDSKFKMKGVQLLVKLPGEQEEKKALLANVQAISESDAVRLFLQCNPTLDEIRLFVKSCTRPNLVVNELLRKGDEKWVKTCVELDPEAAISSVNQIDPKKAKMVKKCLCDYFKTTLLLDLLKRLTKLDGLPFGVIEAWASAVKQGVKIDEECIPSLLKLCSQFVDTVWHDDLVLVVQNCVNSSLREYPELFLSPYAHRVVPEMVLAFYESVQEVSTGLHADSLAIMRELGQARTVVFAIRAHYKKACEFSENTFLTTVWALSQLEVISQDDAFWYIEMVKLNQLHGHCESVLQMRLFLKICKMYSTLIGKSCQGYVNKLTSHLTPSEFASQINELLPLNSHFSKLFFDYLEDPVERCKGYIHKKEWDQATALLLQAIDKSALQASVKAVIGELLSRKQDNSHAKLFALLSNYFPTNALEWISAFIQLQEQLCFESIQQGISAFIALRERQEPSQFDQIIWLKILSNVNWISDFETFRHVEWVKRVFAEYDLGAKLQSFVERVVRGLEAQPQSMRAKYEECAHSWYSLLTNKDVQLGRRLFDLVVSDCSLESFTRINALIEPLKAHFQQIPKKIPGPLTAFFNAAHKHGYGLQTSLLIQYLLTNKQDAVWIFLAGQLMEAPAELQSLLLPFLIQRIYEPSKIQKSDYVIFCRFLDCVLTNSGISAILYRKVFVLEESSPLKHTAYELSDTIALREGTICPALATHPEIYETFAKHYKTYFSGALKASMDARKALEIDLSLSIHQPQSVENLVRKDAAELNHQRIPLFIKQLQKYGWDKESKALFSHIMRCAIMLELGSVVLHSSLYRVDKFRWYYDAEDSTVILSTSRLTCFEERICTVSDRAYLKFVHECIMESLAFVKQTEEKQAFALNFALQLMRNKIEQDWTNPDRIVELEAFVFCIGKESRFYTTHQYVCLTLLRMAFQRKVFASDDPRLATWLHAIDKTQKEVTDENVAAFELLLTALDKEIRPEDAKETILRLQNELFVCQESYLVDNFEIYLACLEKIFSKWIKYPKEGLSENVIENMQGMLIPNTAFFGVDKGRFDTAKKANELFFDTCFGIYETPGQDVALDALIIICQWIKQTKGSAAFCNNDAQFAQIIRRIIPMFTDCRKIAFEPLKLPIQDVLECLRMDVYEQKGSSRLELFDELADKLLKYTSEEEHYWSLKQILDVILQSDMMQLCGPEHKDILRRFAQIVDQWPTEGKNALISVYLNNLVKTRSLITKSEAKQFIRSLPSSFYKYWSSLRRL